MVPISRSQMPFAIGLRGGIFGTRNPKLPTEASSSTEKIAVRLYFVDSPSVRISVGALPWAAPWPSSAVRECLFRARGPTLNSNEHVARRPWGVRIPTRK